MTLHGPGRSITAPLAQPRVQITLVTFSMTITVAMVLAAILDFPGRAAPGPANGCNLADGTRLAVDPDSRIQIDINTADSRELSLLPGIGPVLARRIIDDRGRRGAFTSVDDLQRVFGVGPKTIGQIECYCFAAVNRELPRITVASRPLTETSGDRDGISDLPDAE